MAHGAHVLFIEAVQFPLDYDNRIESHELLQVFKGLAVTADGVLDWEHGNLSSDVSEEFDEDFRPFRDLAAAGIAFKNHCEYKHPGPLVREDAQL
jgi:hypothetical protein